MRFIARVLGTSSMVVSALVCGLGGRAVAQEALEIRNWAAPPYWVPPSLGTDRGSPERSVRGAAPGEPAAPAKPLAGPAALPFFALTPCRLADTRPSGGFTGAFGPPFMTASTPRGFPITGSCGIPAGAQAVSMTLSVTNTTGPGFLLCFPQGGTQALTASLTFEHAGQTISNAAILALGAGGGLTILPGVSGVDLIIDVNGYYAPSGVVTGVNTFTGDVTLQAGANVSITPAGNVLTIAMAGAPPTGPAGGGLSGTYPNPTVVSSSANTGLAIVSRDVNGGFSAGTVKLDGDLYLPATDVAAAAGAVVLNNARFLHARGTHNTFLGTNAGSLGIVGSSADNTGAGFQALQSLSSGYDNAAFGSQALQTNSAGFSNTAVGSGSLQHNNGGSSNTAVGTHALNSNPSGYVNVAVGALALANLVSGTDNIAIGASAGLSLTSGSSNIYVGNSGPASESSTIRVGSGQSATYMAGIYSASFGGSGLAVSVDSAGKLGTTASSRRYKDSIADIGDDSDVLQKLRPVSFFYTADAEKTPIRQYGLIAEEVAEVAPGLVVYDSDGRPQTVRYHLVNAMLLNEVQKQRKLVEELTRRLEQLERR